MSEPTTDAGRALVRKAKRDWEDTAQFMVPAIEAEARAAVIADLRAKVEWLPTVDYPGAFNRSAEQFRDDVLDLLDPS